jgi:hypothetical protein
MPATGQAIALVLLAKTFFCAVSAGSCPMGSYCSPERLQPTAPGGAGRDDHHTPAAPGGVSSAA